MADAIRQFSLLQPGDRVLCALSGGADSVCLTHLLATRATELGITVAAAHFSHGLRPESARAERDLCQRLCDSLGLELFWEKMEHQYSTHIAQGGTNISGGQKQRLAIARAIAPER